MSVYPYIVDIPVREMVVPCIDGHTVYISDKLTKEGQLKAYEHALKHIYSEEDFEPGEDVQEIEGRTH